MKKLLGIYDRVKEEVISLGLNTTKGAYTRGMIPQFKDVCPLKDLEIIELGEIDERSGEIKPITPIHDDWKKLYEFNIEGKAVENKEDTPKED